MKERTDFEIALDVVASWHGYARTLGPFLDKLDKDGFDIKEVKQAMSGFSDQMGKLYGELKDKVLGKDDE